MDEACRRRKFRRHRIRRRWNHLGRRDLCRQPQDGFNRVAHLRQAALAGGDAAAECPPQAAAGFLAELQDAPNFDVPDFTAAPFFFPPRYRQAVELIHKGVRTFATTSMGRLFDTAAALLGFTRDVTFEGQAAIWLEQLARRAPADTPYPFPFTAKELDFRPLLQAVIEDRLRGKDCSEIARSFQLGIAQGLHQRAGSRSAGTMPWTQSFFPEEFSRTNCFLKT